MPTKDSENLKKTDKKADKLQCLKTEKKNLYFIFC